MLETAVLVGDRQATELLYKRLEGAEEWVVFGATSNARVMGLAASRMGDAEAARKHLDTALRLAEKMHDRLDVARTRLQLAQLLFEYFPDEKAEAAEHLTFVTQEFQAMKMQPALEDAMRLRLQFQGITSSDVNTSIDTVARVVAREQPDLRQHAAPDGTVTIMFSDIEGSTEKTDRLGDKAWIEVLRQHNDIVRKQVSVYGGFEVKNEGDGFMVAFQSAGRAVECATAIQAALSDRNKAAEEPLQVRMGLHTGEVIKEGEDFFGRNVIMAARVAAQARGGEILASSVVKSLLQGSAVPWGEKRAVELKGLPGEHDIWPVNWTE
jgi:class 3 adenylate cyclase